MDGGVRLKAGEQWSAMRAAGLLGVRMERGKRALSPFYRTLYKLLPVVYRYTKRADAQYTYLDRRSQSQGY